MSAIAVNNNNDKNEVENIIIYFETLPPVMINLIIQFLKLKGEVEYGLTLGGNPSSEVYRLQVGEALQFSLTCKLHHQIFDDSFQYFCFRDFGANINAANVFYPTLIYEHKIPLYRNIFSVYFFGMHFSLLHFL